MKSIYGFVWIILVHQGHALSNIYISPKSNVLQGERVNISCITDVTRGLLTWSHNNKDVAENINPYTNGLFEIHLTESRYDLIIKNATLKHRGKWACKFTGDELKYVYLNVSVPWTLRAISAEKIADKKVAHNVKLDNNSYGFIETGHKSFPYNLLANQTLRVSCESECGLPPPRSISVQYVNRSNTGELSGGRQLSSPCSQDPELRMLTHTIDINCLSRRLAGRNEIMCQSQDSDGNVLSNKPIFILCPTLKSASELTKGEMIAIAVSIFLAIFDVVVIVLLLRQNCRQGVHSSPSKSEVIRCPEVML